jgi:hypothetical protein
LIDFINLLSTEQKLDADNPFAEMRLLLPSTCGGEPLGQIITVIRRKGGSSLDFGAVYFDDHGNANRQHGGKTCHVQGAHREGAASSVGLEMR